MAADILVLGMSIWLGEKSSVATQIVERLYGNSHLLNDDGQYAYYGRVGGCLVTGNEDGVKHCAMNTLYSLQHLGYTIPPQADSGWIGEAGPGPSYLDEGSGGPENDFTNRNTTFAAWNMLHLARMLKDAGGIPAHGNQRTAWDAGCRFDFPNPELPLRRRSPDGVVLLHHAEALGQLEAAEGAGEGAEAVAVAGADEEEVLVAGVVGLGGEVEALAVGEVDRRPCRRSGPGPARSARRRPRSPARCCSAGSLTPSTRFQASGAAVGGAADPGRPAPAGVALVVAGRLVVDAAGRDLPAPAGDLDRPLDRHPGALAGPAPAGAAGADRLDRRDLAEPQAGAQARRSRSPGWARPSSPRGCRAAASCGRRWRPALAVPAAPRRTGRAARPRPAPRRASAPRRRRRRSASACASGRRGAAASAEGGAGRAGPPAAPGDPPRHRHRTRALCWAMDQ